MIELVEEEVRDLLSTYEFPGDEIPIIKGSAFVAMENHTDADKTKVIHDLYDAMDTYFPIPDRAVDKDFLMPIEDIFSIQGRGTVVTGRIDRGIVKVGDSVEIVGLRDTQTTTCTGVEMFNKLLDEGQAGDNIGALLRGVDKKEVERGQVLAKPGSITPHSKFRGQIYALNKDEGGRHSPFMSGYRPQFYFRTTDVTGTVTLPDDKQMVMPGDNSEIDVELIKPIAMEKGSAVLDPRGWSHGSQRPGRRYRRIDGFQASDEALSPCGKASFLPFGGNMTGEKIRVRLRGFDVQLVDQSARSIVQTVQRAGANVSGPIPLPTRINKFTVLRGPHVNKKAREQFEMRTHKRLIDIIEPSSAVMDSLMKLELPAGVDVEIKQ